MADELKPPAGGDFGEEKEPDEVPEWFMRYLHGALKRPLFSVPKPFETWMIDKVASSGFDLPVSQIVGYAQQIPQEAPTITATEGRTLATYGDLATVGPQLLDLPDGKYLLLFGCSAHSPSGAGDARMSLEVNGVTALDDDAVLHSGGNFNISMARALVKTLDAGGINTVVAKYKGSGATQSNFLNRWLIAIRMTSA